MNVSSLTRGLCSATAAIALSFASATLATAETITIEIDSEQTQRGALDVNARLPS